MRDGLIEGGDKPSSPFSVTVWVFRMINIKPHLIILVILVSAMGLTSAATAGPYEDALRKFTADSYSDTEAGIVGIAESGDSRAEAIIEALRNNTLVAGDGRVALRNSSGAFVDAATGEATASTSLKPVRVNNRVRRAIDAALGSLTLLSADPHKRADAAAAVFRSRDTAAMPALDKALARETDNDIKAAMLEARAAIILNQPDSTSAQRLGAVATLRELAEPERARTPGRTCQRAPLRS